MIDKTSGDGEGRKKEKQEETCPQAWEKEGKHTHKFKNYLGNATEQLQVAPRGQDTTCGAPTQPRACAEACLEATVFWDYLRFENGHLSNSQSELMPGRDSKALELHNGTITQKHRIQ